MVNYSVEAINVIFLPVCQFIGRPNFCMLWQLSQELQECLGNTENPDHTYEGYAGYMMKQGEYALYLTCLWTDLNDVGNYFILPTTAITNTYQNQNIKNDNQGRTY